MRLPREQKKVLKSIALHGPGNILKIQERTEGKYASTHRSIRKLEELGFIYLSRVGDRGPKSPREYSITPLGILASIVMCQTNNENSVINEQWSEINLYFVRYWNEYQKFFSDKELETVASQTFDRVFSLLSEDPITALTDEVFIQCARMFDQHILDVIFSVYSTERMPDVIEVIKPHEEYFGVLNDWLEYRKWVLGYVESILD